MTTYYSSAPPRQQQQQQQLLERDQREREEQQQQQQQQVPRVQLLEAPPRQQQQPQSGAAALGLGHGHGHPAPLGLGPPSPSALSFASAHLPTIQPAHQGSQLSPSNQLSTHQLPQHAAPSKPAHPLLTPSGRAFAVGGRVQNVSRDPRAPCVMYWPDNEALPEQGRFALGVSQGSRCVVFSFLFLSLCSKLAARVLRGVRSSLFSVYVLRDSHALLFCASTFGIVRTALIISFM